MEVRVGVNYCREKMFEIGEKKGYERNHLKHYKLVTKNAITIEESRNAAKMYKSNPE